MRQLHLPMRIWDVPTRLFHWALVILVFLCWLTHYKTWTELHFLSGYAVLALLLFRVVWGVIGSDTARFTQFLKNPLEALRHLSHLHRREPDLEVGHNAAGGWMVVVILLMLLAQVTTGLFNNTDDIADDGPLARFVGRENSNWFGHLHALNFKLIQLVILAHVSAIVLYFVLKGHNLVRPMITGKKRMPGAMPAPRMVHPVLALIVLAVAAGAVALFVRLVS